MTEETDPKVEALAEVAKASEQHTQAISEEEARREAHHAAIVRALRAGAGPSAIEKVSRYDRQHIDRIRRGAGIPATRRATVKRIPADEGSDT
ncbi:hypothetical protein O7626_39795 [Micromonospora sp. WMMD1102]|uniref:hypothetical protein n=1 Tax=Micromonospora sp. WMMD1102 TaxID=3016105 RepID=UPI0024156B94|nr:hypothetical protein [Micromonospora sp. WMMD1102]MDG4791959.1 hypothetical protein [Micromonospora sp. WMMD1102]